MQDEQLRGDFQFATEPVWIQRVDSQPTKVYPPITTFSATFSLVFGKISQGPQPNFKSLA